MGSVPAVHVLLYSPNLCNSCERSESGVRSGKRNARATISSVTSRNNAVAITQHSIPLRARDGLRAARDASAAASHARVTATRGLRGHERPRLRRSKASATAEEEKGRQGNSDSGHQHEFSGEHTRVERRW